jgi:tetratricopeptide (TPR) repeat protein
VLQRNGILKLTRPINAIKPPATVQAVLASRIDRLPAGEKELLQTLAVLGHEFTLTLVQRVWQHPLPRVTALAQQKTSAAPLALSRNPHLTSPAVNAGEGQGRGGEGQSELEQMLSHLQLGEFIYEQPAVGRVEYSFKHALTQEVAYNSLLTERRRAFHERTGRAIEELFPEQLEDHYSDLARHFLRGTDAAKAIHYAQSAAEQALSRGAYPEATDLVDAALKLLDRLPEGRERIYAELALRSHRSVLANVFYGGSSPEREHEIRRVCELSETIGEAGQVVRGMITLCNLYYLRGESFRGLELASRCLEMAEATRDSGLLADAHLVAGSLSRACGHLRQSASYLEAAAFHGGRTDRRISLNGYLYTTTIASHRALALHLLGRVGEALTLAEEAVRNARESEHLFSLGFALMMTGLLICLFRRDTNAGLLRAAETITLSEENGFTMWLRAGRFFHGWSLCQLGQPDQGIAEMEAGIPSYRQTSIRTAVLAESYARVGRIEEGLALLNENLPHFERGAKLEVAELLRIKGEVLLMRDSRATDDAEACFRSALQRARIQEAKWWELRSSVSLARLLRDTHRVDEARTILSEIYNWFTEGFDTADLKEAKALLDELSR